MRGSWCALIGCAFLLVAAQPASGQLIALGDSYSSGEGAPPFDRGTESPFGGCHRSRWAWPMLVAGRLGIAGRSYACSGAEIPQLETQIGLLAGHRGPATLVTLTIGGNDAGFAKVLRRCGGRDSCVAHYEGPGNLDRKIDDLGDRLPDVYDRVQDAMPAGARLVVAGYPRLFPRDPDNRTCAFFGGISAAEARRLNAWGGRLNARIARAAARADAAFIDVGETFDGHEMSCRGEQWVNRLRINFTLSYSFHPNVLGHRALGEWVATALGAPPRALARAGGIGDAGFGTRRDAALRALPGARECEGNPALEFLRGRLVAYATSGPGALSDGMVAVGDKAEMLGAAYNRLGRTQVAAGGGRSRVVYYVDDNRGRRLAFQTADGNVTGFVGRATRRADPTSIC